MVAFQEGDPEAFDTLLRRHERALVNYFYKMCYDRALAEDLKQETFLRILRSAHRYRPEASFKTYLYTVARNLWIDRHRSRKAAPRTVSADLRINEDGATLGDLIESRERGTVRELSDQEAAGVVRAALEDLPEGQRMVFVLAFDQGLKYREISAVLGIPEGTIKSRMHAAVSRLRGLLGNLKP
jgi:RNA polymerase sigma-70 factor (ECF subfamily)